MTVARRVHAKLTSGPGGYVKAGQHDPATLPGSDHTRRAATEGRLLTLRVSIDADLKRLKAALTQGRTDRAMTLCQLIANKRADFLGIASRLHAGLSLDPIPDPQENTARTSPLKTTVKTKRYKRFSEK